ncbi:MAG: thioredoxin family protein [Patescibacteria group bacterium]|jgi:thioredoxin 1
MTNGTTLIKFYATWCQPCKILSNTLSKLLPEFPDVTLEEINIDENVEQSCEYRVRSIPTVILIKDGQEVGRLIGNQSTDVLRKFLTNN